jgi:hypothetical protein
MSCYLAEAKYGKDKVRVFRVVREGETHHVVEYNVQVLVEGDWRQGERLFHFFIFRGCF